MQHLLQPISQHQIQGDSNSVQVTVLEMGGFALFFLKGSFWQPEPTQRDVDLPHRIKKGEGKLLGKKSFS